ncbi:MAG: MarR family transcriptional regulator [Desulfatiglans sp.]|nr:MarR family transcriptional regulator [Desulfatiglans sp.]
MNYLHSKVGNEIPSYQVLEFQRHITKLFQCCTERMQYQSEKFQLPDAELRCLMLFGEERYLTPGGIAQKLNVVRSRVSKIVNGLLKKNLIQRTKDPEDSRIYLLSLTPDGQRKWNEINAFVQQTNREILSQMLPEQRSAVIISLGILEASMEVVKELMV